MNWFLTINVTEYDPKDMSVSRGAPRVTYGAPRETISDMCDINGKISSYMGSFQMNGASMCSKISWTDTMCT